MRQRWSFSILIMLLVVVALTCAFGSASAHAQPTSGRDTLLAHNGRNVELCPGFDARTPTPDPRWLGPPVKCLPPPTRCAASSVPGIVATPSQCR